MNIYSVYLSKHGDPPLGAMCHDAVLFQAGKSCSHVIDGKSHRAMDYIGYNGKIKIQYIEEEEWAGREMMASVIENYPDQLHVVFNKKLSRENVLELIASLLSDAIANNPKKLSVVPLKIGDQGYFTQEQVAELLRCSAATVKKLMASGELAFLPVRPPLISDVELSDYVRRKTKRFGSPKHHPGAVIDSAQTTSSPSPASTSRTQALIGEAQFAHRFSAAEKRPSLTDEEKQRRAEENERRRRSRERQKAKTSAKRATAQPKTSS